MTARDITTGDLALKPQGLVTVTSGATIVEAAKAMASAKIGCLAVVNEKGALTGVFSERDIASRVLAPGLDPAKTSVQQVMSSKVISVRAGTPMDRAEKLMNLHQIRHLPVTAGGHAVGMISSRDVIANQVRTSKAKQVAAEQIAMLSASLKDLEFDDLVTVILREMPRIFSASRAVACLHRKDPTGKVTTLVQSHHCLCPESEFGNRRDIGRAVKSAQASVGPPPAACRRCKAGQSMVLIPLDVTLFTDKKNHAPSHSYLCLCDFSDKDLSTDVLNYKATLTREVLSYNLSHARMWQDTKSLLVTDTLTGAGTRKVLESALVSESVRADRYQRP